MRAVIQRVGHAKVTVDGTVTGEIGRGLLIFLGVGRGDTNNDLDYIVKKTIGLRIFPDAGGKMNLSVTDIGGQALVVSQFTLYGDCRKGNRPSFSGSMPPGEANEMYERFIGLLNDSGIRAEHGVFGADMSVELENDGPVTIILDSSKIL